MLANKKQVIKKTRNDWQITVYELPNSEIFGTKFIATAKKESTQIEQDTGFCDTRDRAYSMACGLADSSDRQEQQEINFQRRYRVLKPLYLLAIYLFSWDEFVGNNGERSPRDPEDRQRFYLEHFVGVRSYKGFDFDILDRLKEEGLLESIPANKTLTINKAAIRLAIEAAQQMNIPGMEELLRDKDVHFKCLDYKNRYERMWEEIDL